MRDQIATGPVVHTSLKHDSAERHVAGSAIYIDDIPEPPGLLHVHVAMSERAHAKILRMDLSAVRRAAGVVRVLTASDIPGLNDVGPVFKDDPVFAEGEVIYAGQSLFAVAAETREAGRAAAALAVVEYEDLPAVLTIAEARAAGLTLEPAQVMTLGDAKAALAAAPHRLQGRIAIGGQEHFYLESQCALAIPGEGDEIRIHASTQHPSELQHLVAHMLHVPSHSVAVEVRRMGGGFGGKETQGALFAAVAALAAVKTGRPAKCRPDRDADMIMTGKRHDFEIGWDAGFDGEGRLQGVAFDLASRCGCSNDLSRAINDRAMFHADNCYFLGTAEIVSHRFKTNTVSNTAFRGFGGPQGMVGIERVMDAVAHYLKLDPLAVRKANLYGPGRDTTPYHQTVEDNIAPGLIAALEQRCDYPARRAAVAEYNAKSRWLKKGIALTPVKFGISFTTGFLNQAGALVHVYADGSILLNHGGTEMGQGLFVKVSQVAADAFGVPLEAVKITATATDKVPNTSATAASSGTDLNGMAVLAACETIRGRITELMARLWSCETGQISFAEGRVRGPGHDVTFGEAARLGHLNRISLSSTGYYATPKIHYDRATHTGHPFYYFAYGAACSEVIIDTLTGENRVLRVDILHDVGKSLNPAIDRGQIEGGFIQGMGWLTTEELVFDDKGHLKTHAPSTYKIPAASDRPPAFNLELWDGENIQPTIHRSKAVGEPPLMLAISVFSALTDAISAAADHQVFPDLDAPATPERVLMAVEDVRRRAGLT
jgi:xanthine dehydrogenase large subunit